MLDRRTESRGPEDDVGRLERAVLPPDALRLDAGEHRPAFVGTEATSLLLLRAQLEPGDAHDAGWRQALADALLHHGDDLAADLRSEVTLAPDRRAARHPDRVGDRRELAEELDG